MQITITTTKGDTTITSEREARVFFDRLDPSAGDVGGIEVAMRYDGSGRYWLADGDGSIDLGYCTTAGEVAEGVAQAILAGSGDEDWSLFEVEKG